MRLRARWVDRGMNENMFGVLSWTACVRILSAVISHDGRSVARSPEILEYSVMRGSVESAIIDYSDALDSHD